MCGLLKQLVLTHNLRSLSKLFLRKHKSFTQALQGSQIYSSARRSRSIRKLRESPYREKIWDGKVLRPSSGKRDRSYECSGRVRISELQACRYTEQWWNDPAVGLRDSQGLCNTCLLTNAVDFVRVLHEYLFCIYKLYLTSTELFQIVVYL